MKKFLTVLLTVVLILINCVMPLQMNIVNAATEDDLTFELNSDGESYSVVDCSSDAEGELVIPEEYNGKPVTSIGSRAFYQCSSLSSIEIPDGVTSIDDFAFSYCISLSSIEIPDGVTRIYDCAFSYCSSLSSIEIPDSVNSIGNSVFSYCSSLSSIKIPDGVTSIGSNAFDYCSSLSSIKIPDGVTSIGSYAFRYCDSLSDVWYVGSDSDAIYIFFGNTCLLNAMWHYNTCNEEHVYISECDSSCDNCEWIRTDNEEHTYDNACDTICNVCNEERTVPHNYEWVIDKENNCGVNGIKHEECTICHITRSEGTEIEATNNHTYDDNCDSECNICGSIREITHMWEDGYTNDTVSHWIKCSVCGVVKDIPVNHDYDNACDTDCNTCDYIRTILHNYDNPCDSICNVCSQERTVPDHNYTLNGNHTCDICKYSKTPAQPAVESKTNNSVTLVQIEGFEYSKDGTSWQTSNTFTGLAADATYIFYQRVKKSTVALVSETSGGTQVTFKSAQNSPSAPSVLSFTDNTITLVAITNGEYSKDGITWQTSNVFTGLSSGTQYTFYQRYAETDIYEYSDKSVGTNATTDKSKQTLIPSAPTVESVTSSSITLVAVEGCEYSKNGTTWYTSNVFSGLSCGTEYTFYQRYKETSSTYAGESSEGGKGKTDKGTQSAPSKPSLSTKTHNSVTLVVRIGYEYSMDGITWQASNIFTGLTPETNYLFYQRRAETDTRYASSASSSLTVKTNEEPQYILGDCNNDNQITDADAEWLLMYTFFPEDYPLSV